MNTVLESAPYLTECAGCGEQVEVTVAEVFSAGRHQWDVEGDCSGCGCRWSECGYPAPLDGMRAAIIAANGTSTLRVVGGGAMSVVMGALRKSRVLSLVEARVMAEELCGEGVEGTRVEVEVLAASLRAVGMTVDIRSAGRGRMVLGPWT